jgi:hypothetical protein
MSGMEELKGLVQQQKLQEGDIKEQFNELKAKHKVLNCKGFCVHSLGVVNL